jgi:hypothetical protein
MVLQRCVHAIVLSRGWRLKCDIVCGPHLAKHLPAATGSTWRTFFDTAPGSRPRVDSSRPAGVAAAGPARLSPLIQPRANGSHRRRGAEQLVGHVPDIAPHPAGKGRRDGRERCVQGFAAGRPLPYRPSILVHGETDRNDALGSRARVALGRCSRGGSRRAMAHEDRRGASLNVDGDLGALVARRGMRLQAEGPPMRRTLPRNPPFDLGRAGGRTSRVTPRYGQSVNR